MGQKIQDDLRSARATLDRVLKRRPTTPEELDGCVAALEELKRICASIPKMSKEEVTELSAIMATSIDSIVTLLKNRP